MLNDQTVLVFGSFDPLHEGHRHFFRRAKSLGSRLVTIVARDAVIRTQKNHDPAVPEQERVAAVAAVPEVDEARLGEDEAGYRLLGVLDFDVLALGYDQQPSDDQVKQELVRAGKPHVKVVRLDPYQPEKYKSSHLRQEKASSQPAVPVYDLHLHSSASDGEISPADVVAEAHERGLAGVSLTDHNGLWGAAEARQRATALGLEWLDGIEITSQFAGNDIHLLGYSKAFNDVILEDGLARTRQLYEDRLRKMTSLCQAQGHRRVSFAAIEQRRSHLVRPSYVTFDLAEQLMAIYGMTFEQARQLTVEGGACHVALTGSSLSPPEAVRLIKEAGGIAVLAHPGITAVQRQAEYVFTLLDELRSVGLDGIEVHHPFHHDAFKEALLRYCERYNLVVTGGSDWHGAGRFAENNQRFGSIGINQMQWETVQTRLTA